jgi:hypothetical protein
MALPCPVRTRLHCRSGGIVASEISRRKTQLLSVHTEACRTQAVCVVGCQPGPLLAEAQHAAVPGELLRHRFKCFMAEARPPIRSICLGLRQVGSSLEGRRHFFAFFACPPPPQLTPSQLAAAADAPSCSRLVVRARSALHLQGQPLGRLSFCHPAHGRPHLPRSTFSPSQRAQEKTKLAPSRQATASHRQARLR